MDVTYQHSLGLEVCWSLHGNDEVTSQGLGMKLGSREVRTEMECRVGLGVTRVPHTRDARTSPRLTQEVNRQQVLGDG